MQRVPLRIVTTNDFVGAFAPATSSYGCLPGGAGLKEAVDALRSESPTIWADVGDFSQGGPLAVLSQGKEGFSAAAELGIDIAVVGNHEFDWGIPLVLEHAPRLGFPLLCANARLGLPATACFATSAGDVGFIGITHPACHTLALYRPRPATAFPIPDLDITTAVSDAAIHLRRQGVDFIVALVHDGIDWSISSDNQYISHPTRFADLCRPWSRLVDVILAGHTLGRFIGHIDATPVLQPWAFGAEIGVVELTRGERNHRLSSVFVSTTREWCGSGRELLERSRSEVVGELRAPLYDYSFGETALVQFIAQALHQATGHDAAIACIGCNQPVLDGVTAMLPSGPVTQLDILRTLSWTDGCIWYGDVGIDEWDVICRGLTQSPALTWGIEKTTPLRKKDIVTITVLSGYVAALLDKIIGRRIGWSDSGEKIDQAVQKMLRRTPD